MFNHVTAADSVLWPLLVLVSIWVFAFLGAFIGTQLAELSRKEHRP